jgi:hypothetical protein
MLTSLTFVKNVNEEAWLLYKLTLVKLIFWQLLNKKWVKPWSQIILFPVTSAQPLKSIEIPQDVKNKSWNWTPG